MESIDIETIEQADLFVFGLNAAQVNEWKEDYKAKHAFFIVMIETNYGYRVDKVYDDFLYRLLFVMVISFERFYQPLPEILSEEYVIELMKSVNEINKERKTLSLNYKTKFIYSRHSQPEFAKYLMSKLNPDNDGWNKIRGREKYLPGINFMMYCETLNTAIEKLLTTTTE